MEAVAILTMLLPMRIVESSRSYCPKSLHARAALALPFSARVLSRVVLAEENAVSVAEK